MASILFLYSEEIFLVVEYQSGIFYMIYIKKYIIIRNFRLLEIVTHRLGQISTDDPCRTSATQMYINSN